MRAWTWTARIGMSAAAATAIVSLLHMPVTRPLLARMAGCPFGGVTPERVELARASALRRLRGSRPAPARPALGFVLEATTLAEVRAWAQTHGIACDESRNGTLLKCHGVVASLLAPGVDGAIEEVAFGFRLADRVLTNITTLRTGMTPSTAAERLSDVAERLERDLGAPGAQRLPGSAWAAAGPAFVSYRFKDYLAEASAIRLPDRGVMLREQYVSARDARQP